MTILQEPIWHPNPTPAVEGLALGCPEVALQVQVEEALRALPPLKRGIQRHPSFKDKTSMYLIRIKTEVLFIALRN